MEWLNLILGLDLNHEICSLDIPDVRNMLSAMGLDFSRQSNC
jgi:hypothetical protein